MKITKTKWVLHNSGSSREDPQFLAKAFQGNDSWVGLNCFDDILYIPTRKIARQYAAYYFNATPRKVTVEVEF
jgi:hypothetical protein